MEKEKLLMVGGVVVILVLSFAGIMLFSPKTVPLSDRTNREIALSCTTDMATQFHIHPWLKIVIDGAPVTIPSNIGIVAGCMNALHTHSADGELHVEAPEKRDFTLGDFFAVWDKPFSKDAILDKVANETHTVTLTVNGEVVDTFENTILKDADQILITYGPKQ